LSKNVALFVDVANLYYSARGQDVDVDYVALLKHATKGRDLIRAYAYSGLDPENENQRKFIDFLSKNGYKVVHKDIRKFGDGRVKANLDIELVVDLFRLADRMDIAVVVSGDGDFAPAIRALQDVGVRCEVISFRPNTSSDLIAVADEFTDIMKIMGIGRRKDEKGLSMPEMPAKELNPEFGFREASPGVAAAAIAAIRDGDTPSRSRRGRPGRTPEPTAVALATTPEEAAAATVPATAAEVAGDSEASRRRRRRRGGRGRGRGRRGEGQAESPEVPVTTGEIGWTEFDDISQLGELTDLGEPGQEREFTFAEADPETLAQLGLAAGAEPSTLAPAPPAAALQAPASPADEALATPSSGSRRRRPGAPSRGSRGGSKPERTAEADAVALTEAPPRPSRRSRRPIEAAAEGTAPTLEASPAEGAAAGADEATAVTRKARSPGGSRTASGGGQRRVRATTKETEISEPPPAKRTGTQAKRPTSRTGRGRGASSPSTSAAGASKDAPPAQDEDAPEGIWQRFRSGRGTRSGS
jgi:uncharacterized LabA/DUF88 family protein